MTALPLLMFPRFQESDEVVDFRGLQRGTERRHVHTTVDDTDDHGVLRELVGNIRELWAATPAVAFDKMAV